jgi:DNA (cytosine-5)-methyltransferase 1
VITVREAARLQSFPDHVAFAPAKKWAYQEIGNSVPPLLGQAVAARLIEYLA